MKESSPFLNILVPLRANRARTILYFIRYQEGPTWNERGSYSGTELLFLRIYLLFRLCPPSRPPLSFHRSLSFFCTLRAVSPRANQPFARSLSFMGDAETRDLALSLRNDRRYATVPLMSDLFKTDALP